MSGSDAGWTTLIDGAKGLENFNRIGDANWRAEDGAIVADKGKGGYPRHEELVQGLPDPRRVLGRPHHEQRHLHPRSDPDKIGADSAYEVNIYDLRPEPNYGTGAIVNFAKVDRRCRRPAASGTPTRSRPRARS